MTCKDCKHWGTGRQYERWDDDANPIESLHKICNGVTLLGGLEWQDDEKLKAVKAYTLDASQYVADLWTAPDFSCALFEAKS